ncbi:MAG: hypothetical protein J0M12_02060 [Deltaproteobacteria bacterium]|nr:hypothetical protein [Deltaproteobacteria bacterium]
MAEEEVKLSPMEEGILRAMSAIDKQVAREMQRTPAELDVHGVQKWEPYQKRIEFITSFVLNMLGDEKVQLDSLLVFAQAFAKSLALVVEDLGEEGLGKLRTEYALAATENIAKDCFKTTQQLKNTTEYT